MKFVSASLVALAAAALLASNAFAAPKLSPQERKTLNRIVDGFVFHAVRHENAAAAYDLVSPDFRAGLSRAEFAKQNPAYPYPARGRHYAWSVDYVDSAEVGGSLMLQPDRKAAKKQGPVVFDIRLVKLHGRWVVDTLVPAAMFGTPTKPKVRSERDYGPGPPPAGEGAPIYRSKVSSMYAIVPFAVFGAMVVSLCIWGLVRRQRARRIAASFRGRDARARPSH
jgi:hypothetical protein